MADDIEYTVTWSEEDQEFVGTTRAFPSLSWLARTEDDALAGIRALVAEVTDDIASEHAEELHSDCAFCMVFAPSSAGSPKRTTRSPSPKVHLATRCTKRGISFGAWVTRPLIRQGSAHLSAVMHETDASVMYC